MNIYHMNIIGCNINRRPNLVHIATTTTTALVFVHILTPGTQSQS